MTEKVNGGMREKKERGGTASTMVRKRKSENPEHN
jgi:hypothetical protein